MEGSSRARITSCFRSCSIAPMRRCIRSASITMCSAAWVARSSSPSAVASTTIFSCPMPCAFRCRVRMFTKIALAAAIVVSAVAIGAASNRQASSLLEYLDADRFWIEPLGAPQLAATGVAACGAQTIHFRAQIDVRDGVEQLLVLGEHRPYQIALLVELHVLADVERRRDIERYDRIILQRSHDVFVAAPQRQIFATRDAGFRV